MERLGAAFGAARRAYSGGGLEPADSADLPAVQLGLVLQHVHEGRPSGVVHGLGQAGADDSLYGRVFYGDRLVFADQRRGQLMLEFPSRVGDPGVGPGQLDSGLVPVLATVRLAGQVSLRPLEFFSALRKNLGETILRPSESTATRLSSISSAS